MQTIADGLRITAENETEWLAMRYDTIGASIAANVVGVGRDAPVVQWQRILRLAPPIEVNDAMRWGKLLEPLVMAEYRRRSGRDPVEQLYFVSKEHEWMTATLDGLTEDGRVVEIKTTSSWARDWGEQGTDHIPEAYLIQVQHQMGVVGADVADVAVLIGGNDYRQYEIARDDRLIAALIHIEEKFMHCLQRQTPPMWGKHDPASLAKLFPGCSGTIDLRPDVETAALHYEALAQEVKRLEQDRDGFKVQVLEALGNAQFGRLPSGQMIKRFLQEMPESTRVMKAHTRNYFRLMRGD